MSLGTPPADLIVHTKQGAGTEPCSSLAISGTRITAVGTRESVEARRGPQTRVYDYPDASLLPGVIDLHTHLTKQARSGAVAGELVECRDFYEPTFSISEILARMSSAATSLASDYWVVAQASPMQERRMTEGRRPTKEELDRAVPHNPAFVYFGAHLLVANSSALRRAGIDRETEDVEGGHIERDPDGNPTGLLRERAQGPVQQASRRTSHDFDLASAIRRQLKECAANGVTMVHTIVTEPEEIQALVSLGRSARLPIRVHMLARVIEGSLPKWALRDLGITHGFGDDMLQFGGVKLSIDGGVTGEQAAFSPIDDEPSGHPLIRIEQQELDEVVSGYHEAGMRVAVHALGDIAVDMAITAFARAGVDRRLDRRHRVEHLGNWMMSDGRLDAIHRLGLVPVANPSFLHFLYEDLLASIGSSRLRGCFPVRTMLDRAIQVAVGSDAPAYWPVDPLRDIGALTTRTTRLGTEVEPGEAISPMDAISLVTRRAAWVGFMESKLGVLEPGQLADVVVVEGNPSELSSEDRGGLKIWLTICNGEIVYENQD